MDRQLDITTLPQPSEPDTTPGPLRPSVSGMIAHPEKARTGQAPPVISFYRATRNLRPEAGAITPLRYERKWILTGLPLTEVLALVRQHPAAFRPAFPVRQVNNVYFDSIDLDSYHAHVSGASRRRKVRLRWYGEFQTLAPHPVLEFKIKHGSAGWKETFPASEALLENVLRHNLPRGDWDGDGVPELARQRLRSLLPTVGNRYQRHYFCSARSGVRITVDSHLSFYSGKGQNQGWHPLVYNGPEVILELKYDDSQVREAVDISNDFPFRLSRCSKYVLGIQHLDGWSGPLY
jgi:hypothetical protein